MHHNYRLCQNHFEEKFISKGKKFRLLPQAVPTIFPHVHDRHCHTSIGIGEEPPRKVIILPGEFHVLCKLQFFRQQMLQSAVQLHFVHVITLTTFYPFCTGTYHKL